MGRNRGRRGSGLPSQDRAVGAQLPPPNTVLTTRAEMFSGPLPPPSILAAYSDIIPDGANRVMVMAEEQSKHRRWLESYTLQSESRRANAGLGAGVVVSLAFLAASVFLIATGHEISGAVLGTVDIVSLAGVFVYGSESRRKEREGRMRALTGDSREEKN